MTLRQAIEIQLAELKEHQEAMEPDYLAAAKLLIEAGKAITYMRNAEHPVPPNLLPGETEQ